MLDGQFWITPLQFIPKVMDGAPSLQRMQSHCSPVQYRGLRLDLRLMCSCYRASKLFCAKVSNSALNDRTKIAVGAEYLPGGNYGDSYLKRIRYRIGFNYSDSYISVKNSRNNEYAGTIGFGFPLLRQKSMINVGLEYATIRPTNKNFLSENYLRLNIGLSFNEMWFLKNRLK